MLCVQIYAFDRSFEGAIAACGAPLVGILAERLFGFKACCCIPSALHNRAFIAGSGGMDELEMNMTVQKAMLAQGAAELDPKDVDMNTKKALALGNALLVCMAVPWALCVIIYTGLHWTYPRDKARAMDLAMEEPSVHPEVDS